jgi:hypothetical protein
MRLMHGSMTARLGREEDHAKGGGRRDAAAEPLFSFVPTADGGFRLLPVGPGDVV